MFVRQSIAGLCKGSTADSDSVCEGSNPSPAAMKETSFVYQDKRGFFLDGESTEIEGFKAFDNTDLVPVKCVS